MRYLLMLSIAFALFIYINHAVNPVYAQPGNTAYTASAGIDFTEDNGG